MALGRPVLIAFIDPPKSLCMRRIAWRHKASIGGHAAQAGKSSGWQRTPPCNRDRLTRTACIGPCSPVELRSSQLGPGIGAARGARRGARSARIFLVEVLVRTGTMKRYGHEKQEAIENLQSARRALGAHVSGRGPRHRAAWPRFASPRPAASPCASRTTAWAGWPLAW